MNNNDKRQINHLHVVCALINIDDKILCVKRGKGRALEGFYEFPGGKIKEGESKTSALIREIKEELDIDITIEKYLGTSFFQYRNILPFDDFDITLYGYLCVVKEGTPKLIEHTDMKLLTKEEMYALDFTKADIPFIDKI